MTASLVDGLRIGRKLLFLSRSQWWEEARIREWQQRRLALTIGHALRNVPYYRDLGVTGSDGLRAFPLLNKDIVQAEGERLRDSSFDPAKLHRSTTSGSSGQPTTTWFDHDTWLLCKYALKIRRTLAGGRPLGERLLIFGEPAPGTEPRQPVPSNRIAYRELRLSVFHPVEEQYEAVRRFAPTIIYGSPSAVQALSDYAFDRGLPLPPVRIVFLSSELLTAQLRSRLQEALRCKVIGVYGSTEFKEVAWQCPAGRYHINFESVFVENVPADGGGDPRIVLTTLVNRAMPLLRFDIGDYGCIETSPCSCGRAAPWFERIAGRRVEYLSLPDGRRVSPYLLTTHIETVPGLRQYQIVQTSAGSLQLRIVMLPGHSPADAAESLRRMLQDLVGRAMPVEVTQVAAIPRTAAGKHQVVIRED